jgi:hypothetical protein
VASWLLTRTSGAPNRGQADVVDDVRPEEKAVGRTAALEVAEFGSLGQVLSGRDVRMDQAA